MFGLTAISAIALALGGAPEPRTESWEIVQEGRTTWAIVIPKDAAAPLRHGAEELREHLRLMSGAELPIVERDPSVEGTAAAGVTGELVVRDDRLAAGQEHRPPLGAEAFRIRAIAAGKSGAIPRIEITGDSQRGALYGCYAFLEDVLGCRWFTATVRKVPERKTVRVGPLDIQQRPAFEYREPYYTEAFERDWAVRNRANGHSQRLDDAVGGHIVYGRYVHTFNELVPPERYFDTHPEYFSQVDGQRKKGYFQLCLTNPDVLRISIETVRQWIAENPKATIFSVSQNDTDGHCQCEPCRAVEKEEGAPSGAVLRFVNAVADAVAKDSPGVLIDTLAYQWTEAPPAKVRPRPNVRIRLAPIGACVAHPLDGCEANHSAFENLAAWARITDRLYIWHYSTNFANYPQPLPDLDEIAGTIPLFRKQGVVGLMYEGDYAPGGGGEMSELKAYLMAKLMWNPDRPAAAIVTEFLDGVYGPAAPQIRAWLDRLHAPARTANIHAHIYDPPTAPYLSDELLTEGTKLFDAAEAAAVADPVALDQVRRARLALEYVQLLRSTKDHTAPGGVPHDVLVERVAAKLRNQGVGQIREGEPVARFLERIGAKPGP